MPLTTPIRLLVVDDHPLMREGIAAVLQRQGDMLLVGEAANGVEAIEAYRRLQPDVTLMDLQMPEMDGLQAIVTLRAEFPASRLLVLTTYQGDAQAWRALKAGAVGYLLKSTLRTELLDAVRTVHSGGRWILPEVAQALARHAGQEMLTDRELAVLQRVAGGLSNREVAQALSLTEDAIKARLKGIMAKLGAKDRTHAVTIALQRGLIRL